MWPGAADAYPLWPGFPIIELRKGVGLSGAELLDVECNGLSRERAERATIHGSSERDGVGSERREPESAPSKPARIVSHVVNCGGEAAYLDDKGAISREGTPI